MITLHELGYVTNEFPKTITVRAGGSAARVRDGR
jgi:hypothetical protein